MRPFHVLLVTAAIVAALGASAAPSARAQGAPPLASGSETQSLPVPDWLMWKVFHESLAFYRNRSPQQVEAMLHERAGMASGQASALHAAGALYVAAIERIDADARAEIQARYGNKLPRRPGSDPPPPPPVDRPVDARPAITLEPGKTLLQMARESGLYDSVEASRQAALSAHVQQLGQVLGAAAFGRVQIFVETTVRPQIGMATDRQPVSSRIGVAVEALRPASGASSGERQ